MLNKQRKRYRRRVTALFLYMVAVMVPARLTADWLAKTNADFAWIKPYILPSMAGGAVFIVACGVLVIFRKGHW